MEYRIITTAACQEFSVPEHILRNEAGWQLRYGEWTDYPDKPNAAGGAQQALEIAIAEMQRRIDSLGK